MDKRDSASCDSQNIPVHLYFDDIPNEPWLHVTVGNNLEILYYISCPKTVDEGIRRRLEKHLDIYKLHELYSSHACSQIADSINMWKKVRLGERLYISPFKDNAQFDINSFHAYELGVYKNIFCNINRDDQTLQELCDMLKDIDEVDHNFVPADSVLQEFMPKK